MITGLVTGGLMLAVSAILIGGAFRNGPSVQVGMPAEGARTRLPHPDASRLLQPKAGRYRIPVTRPGRVATPVPSRRNGPPYAGGTRAPGSPRPDTSRTPAGTPSKTPEATPSASPSQSQSHDVSPTPAGHPYHTRPTLQEAGQAEVRPTATPEPHHSPRSRPAKTPKPPRR